MSKPICRPSAVVAFLLFCTMHSAYASSNRIVQMKNDIETIGRAIDMYENDQGVYPDASEGLAILVERNFLKYLPRDGWNRDFRYVQPGIRNTGSYDLYSLGEDGEAGGTGFASDCGNWDNGFEPCYQALADAIQKERLERAPVALTIGVVMAVIVYLASCVLLRVFGPRKESLWIGGHLHASIVVMFLVSLWLTFDSIAL